MTAWRDLEHTEPDFAQRARSRFDAGRHKTIATLRADGSPRISGIECEFVDGELQFGSMTGARKLADIERDPRIALHGPTFHPETGREHEWTGEAKISGHAVRVDPPADSPAPEGAAPADPDGVTFRVEIDSVVVTRLDDTATKLVIESWTPETGLRVVERD